MVLLKIPVFTFVTPCGWPNCWRRLGGNLVAPSSWSCCAGLLDPEKNVFFLWELYHVLQSIDCSGFGKFLNADSWIHHLSVSLHLREILTL